MKFLGLLIFVFMSSTAVFAREHKCQAKAVQVILSKRVNYGEINTFLSATELTSKDPNWVGYDIAIQVKTRNGIFNQVCRIVMKKSNCSYDNTYGCAATEEDLNNPEQPNNM